MDANMGLATRSNMERKILAVLDEHEQLSAMEIADIMGAHPITVERHCYQLHQNGYLQIVGGSSYTLSTAGADLLVQHR